jgi:hypothetical protein
MEVNGNVCFGVDLNSDSKIAQKGSGERRVALCGSLEWSVQTPHPHLRVRSLLEAGSHLL